MTSAPVQRPGRDETISAVRKRLFDDGVRAAVIYLNGLTEYRFTALYRFGEDKVSSVFFYDRLHPTVTTSPDIPLMSSYCAQVSKNAEPFCAASPSTDARKGPQKTSIQSFCGVPLVDSDGNMFGTLCHFDFSARTLDPADLQLMEAMAQLLREHDRFVLELMESRRNAGNPKLWS